MTNVSNNDSGTTSPSVSSGLGRASRLSQVSFTRPVNNTAYASGDIVSDSTSVAKVLFFPFRAPPGSTALVRDAKFLTDDNNLAANLDLFLFGREPTNFVDNAVWAPTLGDAQRLQATFTFLATNAKALGSLGVMVPASFRNPQPVQCADGATGLFGLLVVRGAWTPQGGSEMVLQLGLELDQA